MDKMKLPPHSIEAEQSVLGAILLEPDSILKASEIISPGDFYRSSHRMIYSFCLEIYEDLSTVDTLVLSERLKAKNKLDEVGGLEYLTDLLAATPTAGNITHYAKIIKEKAILRRIAAWAYELQQKATEGDIDTKEIFNKMESDIIDLSQPLSERKSSDMQNILNNIIRRWDDEKNGLKKYIPTDYKFSTIIPRYVPGHLWIIGGYTSTGKSTLLAQMIIDTCYEGARCLVFSLEDSREDKVIKLLSNLAYTPQTKLMTGELTGVEKKVADATEKLRIFDLHIFDDVYSVDEMRLKIKKHKLQGGVDIVALDFIQNIIGEGTLYERLSEAIVKLQKMAKDLSVTMLIVSQVSNEAMRSNSEIIGLKGAGSWQQQRTLFCGLRETKQQNMNTT
jgi:replicative DNA helicase